jgi:hypothetical protein
MYCPGIKPDAEKPATNHLSYGMAIYLMIISELEHGEKVLNIFGINLLLEGKIIINNGYRLQYE